MVQNPPSGSQTCFRLVGLGRSGSLGWPSDLNFPDLFSPLSALPMFEICPEAQQAVVSALNAHHLQELAHF